MQFKHVNSTELWKGVLDIAESDTRRFKLSSQVRHYRFVVRNLFDYFEVWIGS